MSTGRTAEARVEGGCQLDSYHGEPWALACQRVYGRGQTFKPAARMPSEGGAHPSVTQPHSRPTIIYMNLSYRNTTLSGLSALRAQIARCPSLVLTSRPFPSLHRSCTPGKGNLRIRVGRKHACQLVPVDSAFTVIYDP